MTTKAGKRTRAERLELVKRSKLAEHAATLLHSKEQALERERVRLEGYAARSAEQWERSCQEASSWLLRARMLGAGAELEALLDRPPDTAAMFTAHWQTSMGVTYPGRTECTASPPPPVASTAALSPTIDAYRRALDAAAEHAATAAAVQRLDVELADTRRRRRALEQRLVPQLEEELQALDLYLDEQDREEALRVRQATAANDRPPR